MSDTKEKMRVKINTDGLVTGVNGKTFANDASIPTRDSFQNFAANVGLNTANQSSFSQYGFNPISRNRTQLEWAYRGSWIVRKVVDVVADDMTRAKIQVTSDEDPSQLQALDQYWNRMQIWQRLNETIKWARLYGGCLAVMMIDGHRPEDPLDVETVGREQFKGLLVFDRWMVSADIDQPVTDFGVDFGKPKFYNTTADTQSIPTMKIHHSRCIRMEGIQLPYWQRMTENGWGLSVMEPMYDRLVAFDSTTQGAAQLVYKAHLRTYYVEKLREIIALGGKTYQALLQQVNLIRLMQTNEGMSLFDSTDRFEAQTYSFAGLSDILAQFEQQLSGAADVPLTRLFGQAPAGLNATGESDMRNYYDMINAQQEARMRTGIEMLRSVTYRSRFGKAPEKGETFEFTNLWKMTDAEKAQVASQTMQTAASGMESQILSRQTAMKEIKQSSRTTGFGTNITDREIEAAKDDDPPTLQDLTGNRLDNPLDEIKFRLGQHNDDETDNQAQPGEEQVTGGEEGLGKPEGVKLPDNHTKPRNVLLGHTTTGDRLSVIEVHGLNCIIETAKGESRYGTGWHSVMPAHYGYISGTGSAEGASEQMDCYVGDNTDSNKVFIIHQCDPETGDFDEHKIMMAFDDRGAALTAYHKAFSDGSGPLRISKVENKTIQQLKKWLQDWKYGLPGKVSDDTFAGVVVE